MAKSAKSNVKPFQIDWPRSYWWGLRTAPIPLAAGVDKPLVSRATKYFTKLCFFASRLSSETKCNTPADLIIGTADQDLRECCHGMLFAFVG